ncbi:hypothetical protein MBANPS3_012392, partial [Mucor bainieri]
FIKLKPDCIRKISAANTARSVLKGFDASALFASLANADPSISNSDAATPATPLTAASNAGNSSMDTRQ